MKHVLFFLTIMTLSSFIEARDSQTAGINWLTNYNQAIDQAKKQSKPILLFFTGSDWCSWCQKLDSEALETPEFSQLTKNQFIFLKLDFPSKKKLSEKETENNRELQKKYHVRGFPTVILLDSKGEQIGITGYRPGGGKDYAEHLLKMVKDYSGYKEKVSSLDRKNFSGNDLKNLYEQAQTFHCKADATKIIQKGITSDDANYFMLESLRHLASENKLNSKEATSLREQLLKKDPNNKQFTAYHLAVIDFESHYKEMKENKRTTDSTLSPLLTYIDQYGGQDRENIWRLNMIIAQVLYDLSDYKEALKFAKYSMDSAPTPYRSDIAEVIDDINEQMEFYR